MNISKKVKEFFNKRSKILFFIIGIFIFVNILDLFTAMFILPGEANPLWLLFKSKLLLVVFKFIICLMMFSVFYYNKYPSRFWYFSFIYTLVNGTLLISLGVASNIVGILNNEIVENSATITPEVKMQSYFFMVGLIFFLPYVLAMLAFKLYDISEKFVEYDKK